MKRKILSKAVLVILIWAVVILCCALGRQGTGASPAEVPAVTAHATSAAEAPPVASADERRLDITAEEAEGARFSRVFSNVGGHTTELYYWDLEQVRMDFDGKSVYLEDALETGLISPDGLFAYARMDAGNGFCEDLTRIRNGSALFIYRYPEYDLRLTYDFSYTPPDGKGHLVSEVYLCRNGNAPGSVETAAIQEDWGLTFRTVQAASTTLTLAYTQKGGQQLGTLLADFYYIDPAQGGESLSRLEGADDTGAYQPKPVLEPDTAGEITLDWTNIYGALPSGEYIMTLKVSDVYDPEAADPEMEKFRLRQSYSIAFSIP